MATASSRAKETTDATTTPRSGHANKQCLSFPAPMLQEIEREAGRLDRSVSWVVQRAWRLARAELRKLEPT